MDDDLFQQTHTRQRFNYLQYNPIIRPSQRELHSTEETLQAFNTKERSLQKSKIYSYSFTCRWIKVQDMINISSGNTSDVESWAHMPVPRTLAGAESPGALRTGQSHSYQSTATRWTTRTFGNPLDAQALPSQPALPAGSHSDTSSDSHPG